MVLIRRHTGVWDEDAKEYKFNPDTGNYEVGNGLTYEGENLWRDGRIVVLVNSETISAGDHLTQMIRINKYSTVLIQHRHSGISKLSLRKCDPAYSLSRTIGGGGGSPQFIMAIAELLAPEGEHDYAYDGVWDEDAKEYKFNPDTGNYEVGACLRQLIQVRQFMVFLYFLSHYPSPHQIMP